MMFHHGDEIWSQDQCVGVHVGVWMNVGCVSEGGDC